MSIDQRSIELNKSQFFKISRLVYESCGINLQESKLSLVQSRLMKRLRALGLDNFEQYITFLGEDTSGQEFITMIDIITTNKTSFFREPQHFDYIRKIILPDLKEKSKIRVWSAGCSSGEEPYSLGILFKEEFSTHLNMDIKILATDISPSMLKLARDAIYDQELLEEVPHPYYLKYFYRTGGPETSLFKIKNQVTTLVRFAGLNLVAKWPMKGPFDFIFCRNVMIYFDKKTRENLINKFWQILAPGGYLFVGHSESLTSIAHKFHYVQPAVYRK